MIKCGSFIWRRIAAFVMLLLLQFLPCIVPVQAADQFGNTVEAGQICDISPITPGGGAGLKNCEGMVFTGGALDGYSIENAIGNGLNLTGNFCLVGRPKIYNATSDGIVIKGNGWIGSSVDYMTIHGTNNGLVIIGDGCSISGGTIDGARGAGVLIIGNNNTVLNMTITNCHQPVVIRGRDNRVTWGSQVNCSR